MKRKTSAQILIAAFMFSAVAGTSFVKSGTANPTVQGYLNVTLLSPENRTYTDNTLPITFRYSYQQVKDPWYGYLFNSTKPYYKYTLDGQESALYLADLNGSRYYGETLRVPEGTHTLTVHVKANSGGPPPAAMNLDYFIGYSQTVTFTVDTTPENSVSSEPELFPTAYSMGFVALIVLALLGSIVYVLKRKS